MKVPYRKKQFVLFYGALLLCALFNFLSVAHAQLATGQSKYLGSYYGPNFSGYWNQLTAGGYWGVVEPVQNSWDWSEMDTEYNYAISHGFPFKWHNFVWSQAQPEWIYSLDEIQQYNALVTHMQATCARYPLTTYIDVVNEPLHTIPPYYGALGGTGWSGYDWVLNAFSLARYYCPNAKLLLNEYDVINNRRINSQSSETYLDRYIYLVNLLRTYGLIDGIGVQAHADDGSHGRGSDQMDSLPAMDIFNNLTRLHEATGLPIHVSELDMTGDDVNQQDRYRKFAAIWGHPGVAGVTLWGYVEGGMWNEGAYLVRADGSERPAMEWLRSYLNGSAGMATVRARGSTGTEKITLVIDDIPLASWTLTTDMRDYPILADLYRTWPSHKGSYISFTNDGPPERDVQIDYLKIRNDDVRQAEHQATNTGVYQNSTCGGGSGRNEWMHCNGLIGFGEVGAAHRIAIRAGGVSGVESITLRVNGDALRTWTLGTGMQDYIHYTNMTGYVTVEYTNDSWVNDVRIDYVSIDGDVRQSEYQNVNTGVYQYGACGGGYGYSEWLNCNGYIGYGYY